MTDYLFASLLIDFSGRRVIFCRRLQRVVRADVSERRQRLSLPLSVRPHHLTLGRHVRFYDPLLRLKV
jgi:hypothetical protein